MKGRKKSVDRQRKNVEQVRDAVKGVVLKLTGAGKRLQGEVDDDSSVIEDLGLTSLQFVDLTVALEKALGIRRFPIQQWIDSERRRSGKRFTVRSLVDKCMEAVEKSP